MFFLVTRSALFFLINKLVGLHSWEDEPPKLEIKGKYPTNDERYLSSVILSFNSF